jgi:cytochrome c-type biogenesis protein CcmH/NrfG
MLTMAEVQILMDEGDFDTALTQLHRMRNADPSNPDILAALGWSAWRSGATGTNAYDGPEDFLLLALTFDSDHAPALEYFARMAIETGDVETARNRLLQVLQVQPEAQWARDALESDALSAKTRNPRGRGLRFWPRGKA